MQYLTRDDLKARGINFTNKHLLALERAGRFPRRVRLGHSTVAWIEPEIDEHQRSLAAARDAAPPKAA